MAITNQADLETAIANWAPDSQLGAVIPDFVTLAAKRLNRDLRVRFMEKVETGIDTVAGQRSVTVPSDFLEARTLYLDQSPLQTLLQVPPDHFFKLKKSSESGNPIAFTILDDQILFSPTPDAAYDLVLWYWAEQTVQNFIDNAVDAILYASLIELAVYDSDEDIPKWTQLYRRAVDDLTRVSERSRRSRGALQIQRA